MAIEKICSLKGTGKLVFMATALSLVFFAGCSKKKEQSAQPQQQEAPAAPAGAQQQGAELPQGHPAADKTAENITKASHANIKTQKEVRISDAVKARWKEVKLEIRDNNEKRTEAVTIQVGQTVTLTKDGYKLKVETFVPDYAIAENRIESRSNEPKNPAVLVELIQGDKTVARGWVFRNFPDFNSYNSERFPISLVAPGSDKK